MTVSNTGASPRPDAVHSNPTTGGHGQQVGRGGSHGHGGNGSWSNNRFQGAVSDMKRNVFTMQTERVNNQELDQFVQTAKHISYYMGRSNTSQHVREFCMAIDDLTLPEVEDLEPIIDDDPSSALVSKWMQDYKENNIKKADIKKLNTNLYNLVIGQCSPLVVSRIESHSKFAGAKQNGIELLKIVKEVTCSFEENANKAYESHKMLKDMINFRQGKKELHSYFSEFQSHDSMMNQVGAGVCFQAVLDEITAKKRPSRTIGRR